MIDYTMSKLYWPHFIDSSELRYSDKALLDLTGRHWQDDIRGGRMS